jgi:Mrp family chromosome partitioning ATPase/uncharacterized protein involved in exopolysaccharide biosynthesis
MNAGPIFWKRAQILALSLLASGLLAGVYCLTRAPLYQASAEFTVRESSQFAANGDGPSDPTLAIEQILTNDNLLGQLIESLPQAHRVDWNDRPAQDPREILRGNLELCDVPGQNALRISCRSRQAETAVAILDKMLELGQAALPASETDTSSDVTETLASTRHRLEQELQANQAMLAKCVEDFVSRFGIVPDQATGRDENGGRIQRALEEAQAKHRAARDQLAALEVAIQSGIRRMEPATPPMPQGESSARQTTQVRTQLIARLARREDLLRRYGPAHSRIREVEDQIRRTDDWLRDANDIPQPPIVQVADHHLGLDQIARAKAEVELAKAREETIREHYEIEQAFATERAKRLDQIESIQQELDRQRTEQAAIVKRMNQPALVEGRSAASLITITVPPEVASEPVAPTLMQSFSIAQGLGFVIGLGMIAIRERQRFPARHLARLTQSLGVPLVAGIGELSATGGKGLDAVQTWARLHPTETAAFSTLRTHLESKPESQCLGVTSAIAGEGKTTVAANLAVEFAQSGKKTLLIDANPSSSGLSHLLNLAGPRGLMGLLAEDNSLAESARANIVLTFQPGLDVLPIGPDSLVNPDNQQSARWREFLCWAERIYEQIVIDLPALLPENHAEKFARSASGILLVAQPGQQKRLSIEAVINRLEAANLPWLGIVANRVSIPN